MINFQQWRFIKMYLFCITDTVIRVSTISTITSIKWHLKKELPFIQFGLCVAYRGTVNSVAQTHYHVPKFRQMQYISVRWRYTVYKSYIKNHSNTLKYNIEHTKISYSISYNINCKCVPVWRYFKTTICFVQRSSSAAIEPRLVQYGSDWYCEKEMYNTRCRSCRRLRNFIVTLNRMYCLFSVLKYYSLFAPFTKN